MSAAEPAYTAAYLRWLFGSCPDGFIIPQYVTSDDYWRSACYPVDKIDDAADWCATKSDQGLNVFVRMTLLDRVIPSTKRGVSEYTRWAPVMWNDIDIAAPGHATPDGRLPLPPTVEDADSIASAWRPPTLTADSGGGIYSIHKLVEPINVGEFGRDNYKQLIHRWGKSHQQIGEQRGWHVDNTGDLTRVLRPAGVVRRKKGVEPNLVTVRAGYLVSEATRDYTVDDIESVLLAPAVDTKKPSDRRPAPPGDVWDQVNPFGPPPWEWFNRRYTLAELLDGLDAQQYGPWTYTRSDSEFDYWRRAGTASAYSIKQSHATGVVIVWSSTVAAGLGVRDGEGLDLFGFHCRLHGLDPKAFAADLATKARVAA